MSDFDFNQVPTSAAENVDKHTDFSAMKLPDVIGYRNDQKALVAALNKLAKEAKEVLDLADEAVIDQLDTLGVEGTNVGGFAVNITEEYVPTEVDWDAFFGYVSEQGAFHLLQRRISTTAWREEHTIYGEYPPGTTPLKQRKLSVTKRQSRKKS